MNASPDSAWDGVAFICNASGDIQEFVRDDLELSTAGAHKSFYDIVDKLSVEKTRHFVAALNSQGATFGWEINVPVGQTIVSVMFNGGPSSEGHFLIVGATTRLGLNRLMEELLMINSDQTTALRSALKELSLQQRDQAQRDADFLDELSRLNNELVTLQRELAQKNRDLERLNRLKDTFLGMASHDLRKPVSAILTLADLVLTSPAETEQTVNSVKSACRRIIRQLNDFLDIAQIEAGSMKIEKQSVDLGKLVENRISLYRPLAEAKKIQLTSSIQGSIPPLPLDTDRIEQLVDNLLENAVKYTPHQGRITVSLSNRNEQVLLSIADSGPGLNEEQRRNLFAPFRVAGTRPTGNEKSTGLGLAIVKAIADRHGAKVEIESSPGAGADFIVVFPA